MITPGDPGMNPLDWLNRRILVEAGLIESAAESAAGTQRYFVGARRVMLPSVVLLHGAGDNAGAWARSAPALLAAGYRVVVPDLAGHGTSQPAQGPLRMETLLDGLAGVMQRAAPSGAILIGNSLGAWVAMVWARRNPARVKRLVLVNGGAISGLTEDLTLTPANRDEARRLWEGLVDQSNWAVPDMLLDEIIRKERVSAISRLRIEEMTPHLMDGVLAEFTTPVDLLWGEADRLLPLEYAKRLAAGLPAARLTTIPRCGHVPQLECADAFNRILVDILKQQWAGKEAGPT